MAAVAKRIRVSRFPLQRILQALPRPLRRIRLAQTWSAVTGSPYHRIAFEQGELIGNVEDREVANSLVRGSFADYGYYALADALLVAGSVHVDVGANYGFHTYGLLNSAIGTTIRHVLIEANPDCAACLGESARLHPAAKLQIFHTAAAATAGETRLTFAARATGSGHVGPAGDAGEIEVTVLTRALDDLLQENGIEQVRLMKMDIEGSEPGALRGLSRMLAAHRIDFLYFEVNPGCLKRQQASPTILFEELTRHGYRLFWPHDGLDWITQTLGSPEFAASQPRRVQISGSRRHTVIEFEQKFFQEERFGQCDLLAISPNCRLEEAS